MGRIAREPDSITRSGQERTPIFKVRQPQGCSFHDVTRSAINDVLPLRCHRHRQRRGIGEGIRRRVLVDGQSKRSNCREFAFHWDTVQKILGRPANSGEFWGRHTELQPPCPHFGDSQANTDGGDQYTGLDRFGRVIDQNWVNTSTGTSNSRFQCAYNLNGEVLSKNNLVDSAMSELYSANGASGSAA